MCLMGEILTKRGLSPTDLTRFQGTLVGKGKNVPNNETPTGSDPKGRHKWYNYSGTPARASASRR
jgi:hypothetical protein